MTETEPVRQFVDSNIWLYAFMPTDDRRKERLAKQLLRTQKSNIVISTQVINEVVHNLLRKAGFAEPAVRTLIGSYYREFEVIPVTQAQQETASRLRERYSFSHYDSLIVAAALAAGVTLLASEDMQDGLSVEDTVTIVNPFRM